MYDGHHKILHICSFLVFRMKIINIKTIGFVVMVLLGMAVAKRGEYVC